MNWVNTGSSKGFLPVQFQTITWTNIDLLSIEPLATHFSEIQIEIQTFSVTKMHLKMSSRGRWVKHRNCCDMSGYLILSIIKLKKRTFSNHQHLKIFFWKSPLTVLYHVKTLNIVIVILSKSTIQFVNRIELQLILPSQEPLLPIEIKIKLSLRFGSG